MDEKKKLQRVGLAVAGIILLVAGLWFLFGNVDTNTGHRDNVESGFDDLDREQQEAAASLETVRDRAADSQQSVERIAGSIDESQNAAERIERANSELASSIDSITERNRAALERLGEALSRLEAAQQVDTVLYQLLLPCLQGEVALSKGNLIFPRVSILCDEVAGVASKFYVFYFTGSTLADRYHFPDVGKMIRNCMSSGFAGVFCLVYDSDEI